MENPTPFDLNEAIRRWQKNLGASPAFNADNLEELASHLRASVQKLKAAGLSEEEAFKIARLRIGERGPLEREFAKLTPALNWSLTLLSFWIVAGVYVLHVGSSLVFGLLNLLKEMAHWGFWRLLADGANIRDSLHHICWIDFCNLPGSFAPQTSLALIMVFVLCVRLAAGNWTGFGAVIRSFKRPIRAAVVFIGLGHVLAFLPYFLFSLLPPGKHALPLAYFLRPPHSTNDISGLLYSAFQMGLFGRDFAVPPAGVLAAQSALIVVLVLTMVLLARQGLRKIPLAG
jgi:hypothetical protein